MLVRNLETDEVAIVLDRVVFVLDRAVLAPPRARLRRKSDAEADHIFCTL